MKAVVDLQGGVHPVAAAAAPSGLPLPLDVAAEIFGAGGSSAFGRARSNAPNPDESNRRHHSRIPSWVSLRRRITQAVAVTSSTSRQDEAQARDAGSSREQGLPIHHLALGGDVTGRERGVEEGVQEGEDGVGVSAPAATELQDGPSHTRTRSAPLPASRRLVPGDDGGSGGLSGVGGARVEFEEERERGASLEVRQEHVRGPTPLPRINEDVSSWTVLPRASRLVLPPSLAELLAYRPRWLSDASNSSTHGSVNRSQSISTATAGDIGNDFDGRAGVADDGATSNSSRIATTRNGSGIDATGTRNGSGGGIFGSFSGDSGRFGPLARPAWLGRRRRGAGRGSDQEGSALGGENPLFQQRALVG